MALASCPFDKSHRVEVLEMALHIETCRQFHPGVRRVQCQDHEVSIENYPTHLFVCSSNRDGPLQAKKKPKKNPKANGDVSNGASASLKNNQPKKKQPVADHFYPPVLLTDTSTKGKQKNKNAVGKQNKENANKTKSAKTTKAKNKKPQKKEVGSPRGKTWSEELDENLSSGSCLKIKPIPEILTFEPDYLKKNKSNEPKVAEEPSPSDMSKPINSGGCGQDGEQSNLKECVSMQKDKCQGSIDDPPCEQVQNGEENESPQISFSGKRDTDSNTMHLDFSKKISPLKLETEEPSSKEVLKENLLNDEITAGFLGPSTNSDVSENNGNNVAKCSNNYSLTAVDGQNLKNELDTGSDAQLSQVDDSESITDELKIDRLNCGATVAPQEETHISSLSDKNKHDENLQLPFDSPKNDVCSEVEDAVEVGHAPLPSGSPQVPSTCEALVSAATLPAPSKPDSDDCDGLRQEELQVSKKVASTLNPNCAPFELKITAEKDAGVTAGNTRPPQGVIFRGESGSIPSSSSAGGNSTEALTLKIKMGAKTEEDAGQANARENQHVHDRDIIDQIGVQVEHAVKEECTMNELHILEQKSSGMVVKIEAKSTGAVTLPVSSPALYFVPEARNTPPAIIDYSKTVCSFANQKSLTAIQGTSTPLEDSKIPTLVADKHRRDTSVGVGVHRAFEVASSEKIGRVQSKRVSDAEGREEGMDTICSDDVFESEGAHQEAFPIEATPGKIPAMLPDANFMGVYPSEALYGPSGGILHQPAVIDLMTHAPILHQQADSDFTTHVPVPRFQQFDVVESVAPSHELVSNEVLPENKASVELTQEGMVSSEGLDADWKLKEQDHGIAPDEQGALPEGAVVDFNEVVYIPYGKVTLPVKPEHTLPCVIRLKKMPGPIKEAYQKVRKEVTNLNKRMRKLLSPEDAEFAHLKALLKKAEDQYEDYLNEFLNYRA